MSSKNIQPANSVYGGLGGLNPSEAIQTERILQVPVTIIFFLPSTRIPALAGDLHRGALHRLTRPTLVLFPWLPVTPPIQFGFPHKSPISRSYRVNFNLFLKFYCYAFLVFHMVPGALVPLHDQHALNWIEKTCRYSKYPNKYHLHTLKPLSTQFDGTIKAVRSKNSITIDR